ncbi:hypothetical protein D3C86_2202700 [compost metagenome]
MIFEPTISSTNVANSESISNVTISYGVRVLNCLVVLVMILNSLSSVVVRLNPATCPATELLNKNKIILL